MELDPENKEAIAGMGGIGLLTDDLDEAERWYLKLLEMDAESNPGALGLARVRLRQGGERVNEAIDLCQAIIERNSHEHMAYDVLGNTYQILGNHDKAKQFFQRRDEILAERNQRPNP